MAIDIEALVEELAEELGDDVRLGKIFGKQSVMYRGKAIGCLTAPGAFVIPLDEPEHTEALALDGAHLFDPSGKGRPMKAWVVMGEQHEERFPDLLRASARRVDLG
jgi:hypothetical protein